MASHSPRVISLSLVGQITKSLSSHQEKARDSVCLLSIWEFWEEAGEKDLHKSLESHWSCSVVEGRKKHPPKKSVGNQQRKSAPTSQTIFLIMRLSSARDGVFGSLNKEVFLTVNKKAQGFFYRGQNFATPWQEPIPINLHGNSIEGQVGECKITFSMNMRNP